MQITAFGADDVPDVKMSAHREPTSGSRPASSVERGVERVVRSRRVERARRQPRLDRRQQRRDAGPRSRSSPTWVCSMSRRRCSSRRVWFKPDDDRAGQRRAAESEQVLGRVVEQHTDVQARRRVCSVRAPRTGSPSESTRPGTRAWVHVRSSKWIAARPAVASSVPLRRSNAAAFGAGSGACPGAGAVRALMGKRSVPALPDADVREVA